MNIQYIVFANISRLTIIMMIYNLNLNNLNLIQ